MELTKIISPIVDELSVVKLRYIQTLRAPSEPINGIGRYISKNRGKFFRPALVLLSAKLGDAAKLEKAIAIGVAVELIHSASLIHDDIIDEAALRRNQKTVNTKWGNAISVIAGDYLLAKAWGIVSKLDEPRVLSVFSKTAAQMCEGEMIQLANAYNFAVGVPEYLKIIKRKTAYLISDCCASGGILGGLTEKEIEGLSAYGLNLGMAFQIVDDCLDLVGEETRLGKPLWQDMEKGKLTLPMIFLLKGASKKKRRNIIELITLGGNRSHRILKEEALNSGAITRSRRAASGYIKAAKNNLSDLNASLKKTFYAIADYALDRKK